ncbi:MAG: hypothetical protein HDQ96_06995 [Lachnospiraceae bacterium]|nr:hypothetical protein [Lachnospiraceae bacterium]
MGYRDELESLGVNVDEGIDRVMGDEAFYETMLGIFVDTVNENKINLEDFAKDNVEDLIGQVHMMKGMTGNLSITPLFNGYMEVLGLLRDGKPKEAGVAMEKVLPVQEKIVECIKNHGA